MKHAAISGRNAAEAGRGGLRVAGGELMQNTRQGRAGMIIRNEDISRVIIEIPAEHRHLRTTVTLSDGSELVFQEATIANIVRAYVSLKTHPTTTRVVLQGGTVVGRKEGFAEWQLLES